MDFSTIQAVAGIAVICYVIGLGCKISKLNDEWIPVITAVTGGILGVVGLYIMPEFPANDLINAIAVGAVSGLSATGANQIYKQLIE